MRLRGDSDAPGVPAAAAAAAAAAGVLWAELLVAVCTGNALPTTAAALPAAAAPRGVTMLRGVRATVLLLLDFLAAPAPAVLLLMAAGFALGLLLRLLVLLLLSGVLLLLSICSCD